MLKNTRPITLLDTARKLMNRLLYKRLSYILHDHHVLTGGNFAGLPGGTCDIPIAVLESIIYDAKITNSPLYLFFLDISKAFDSIDTAVLKLAMERLHLPPTFIHLILELFTNRFNSIITAYGSSDYIKH
jgi:hypothetical protein